MADPRSHGVDEVTVPPYVEGTIYDLIDQQKLARPNKEAVYACDGTLTYQELDDVSSTVAAYLCERGVRSCHTISVCLDKSKWVPIAILATIRTGAAFVAFDPSHPATRLQDIVDQVDAKLIITQKKYEHYFFRSGRELLLDVEAVVERHIARRVSTNGTYEGPSPDDMLFYAFTSGSTGRPKGVMHRHGPAFTSMMDQLPALGYIPEARVLQFSSYAYIPGVWEILRSLCAGSTICIPSEQQTTSDLQSFINDARVTNAFFTPSFLRTLTPRALPTLRHIHVGGEPVDDELVASWKSYVTFVQVYGMSEGVAMVRNRSSQKDASIGLKPLSACAWVVDTSDDTGPVPKGTVEQLVVEGYSFASDYLNDAEKTQAIFGRPAWADRLGRPRDCCYVHTGDLARMELDGSFTVLGRADTQVKIHGQRIELTEVESAIRKARPDHGQAVVDLVPPTENAEQPLLTASIEAEGNGFNNLVTKLQNTLPTVLPRHMVPKAYVQYDKLPQSTSRKIDRKALKDIATSMPLDELLGRSQHGTSECRDEQLTPMEARLRQCWSKVLKMDENNIRRTDSFLALGGDSLGAIKLVSAARQAELQLNVQTVLTHARLSDMANKTGQINNNAASTQTLADSDAPQIDLPYEALAEWVNPSTIEASAPAIDFQSWAIEAAASVGGWIDHFTYDIRGQLNIPLLRQACQQLLATHPILRTVFIKNERQTHQLFLREAPFTFTIHKIDALNELSSLSQHLYAKDAIIPLGSFIPRFDLITIRSDPSIHRLIFRLSHAQYDAFCAPSISTDLGRLYSGAEVRGAEREKSAAEGGRSEASGEGSEPQCGRSGIVKECQEIPIADDGVGKGGEILRVYLRYSDRVFEKERVESILGSFCENLSALVDF